MASGWDSRHDHDLDEPPAPVWAVVLAAAFAVLLIVTVVRL